MRKTIQVKGIYGINWLMYQLYCKVENKKMCDFTTLKEFIEK